MAPQWNIFFLHVCEPMEENMYRAMQHGSAAEFFWHICESKDDRMYAAMHNGISHNILLQGGAKTHRMPYLPRSFSAKEPFN